MILQISDLELELDSSTFVLITMLLDAVTSHEASDLPAVHVSSAEKN